MVTYKGETKNATQWAAYLGIEPATMHRRINSGMSEDRIFTVGLIRRTKASRPVATTSAAVKS